MKYTASDHTFVICAYKSNPYLGETIESLLGQTVKSRVMLSTSTPNDYLWDTCSRYGIEMVINSRPHLAGDDWNYGYDAAGTPLVTIAHQDDYYVPEFLEKTLAVLNQYGDEVQIVFTDYFEMRNGEYVVDSPLLRIKRIMNAPFRSAAFNGRKIVKRRILSLGCPICCPSVTFVARNVGDHPFDIVYKNSCDYKTWVDLASRNGRFVYIPEKLMGHRIYAESATTLNLSENIRKAEDREILSMLWPKFIARAINSIYAQSEKSNVLK